MSTERKKRASVPRSKVKSPEKSIEHLRGLDWFDPKKHSDRNVSVIGCGGIGSFTAIGLAKMFGVEGPTLTLIDFDKVEPHNIPNQMFTYTQVGQNKASALQSLCKLFGGVKETYAIEDKFQARPEMVADIVVCGLDSMNQRDELWEMVKHSNAVTALIDGRLTGQYFTIHTINPTNDDEAAYYESQSMYSDEEAEEAPCTARAIIDVGQHMGGHAQTQIRKVMTGTAHPHTIIFNVETLGLTVGQSSLEGFARQRGWTRQKEEVHA